MLDQLYNKRQSLHRPCGRSRHPHLYSARIAMSNLRLLFLSVLLILLKVSGAARFPMAKPGCKDTCGNDVTIPYPFGIGPDCALSELYIVYCNGSSPFIWLQNRSRPVQEVSLSAQTVTLNYTVHQYCLNQGDIGPITRIFANLTGSPFYFSEERNKLMLLGCGNILFAQRGELQTRILSGCTSICELSNSISGCYGINCCQTSIPFYLNNFVLDIKDLEFNNTTGYTCASAFLVDQRWNPENYSDLFVPRSLLYVPVVLSWILQSQSDVDTISGCKPKMSYIPVDYTSYITNYQCECDSFGNDTWFYGINPYLDGACDYAISQIRGSGKKDFKAAIVGASVGFGVLFLMLSGFALYKVVKKRRNKKRKEKFFKRNGGLLLQQQLSADEGGIEKTMIFTAKDLNKASDGFNENRILGQGGQGTVYKGMLTDGRIVAIKKSKKVDENQLEQFINEVVILSQVNHRNVVKLLGACLETEVPLLVYEFIPNGTLFSLIHDGNDDEFPLTWNLRLRIVTEVARALAYLHSAISIPIYHRDIKSSNILLDEKYIAKVSDFGISRSFATDKTHLTTRVQGTFGYLDPEYFQSSQFTDRSDVYSFGVVLVELLTRQKPISSFETEGGSSLSLATRFLESMEKNSLVTVLDPQIIDQKKEEQIVAVAKLAQRCLNLNGKKRPTMMEAAIELESITMSNMDSNAQANFPNPSCFGREPTVLLDLNYTWTRTTESDSFASASDGNPLLRDTT